MDRALSQQNVLRQRLVRLIVICLSFGSVAMGLSPRPGEIGSFWYLFYSPVLVSGLSFGLRGALLGSAAAISATTILMQRSQGQPLLLGEITHSYFYGVVAIGLGNLTVMILACWAGWQQDRQRTHEQARLRYAAQVDAERSWLQAVIEHSPVGILLIEGARADRVQSNIYAERLFGRAVFGSMGISQFLGRLFSPDGRVLSSEELNAAFAIGVEASIGQEFLIRPEEGKDVAVLVSAVPIQYDTGAPTRIVVIIEDISISKELEREREEWTSLIAHDLRQPMTVIASYAELAAAERTDLLSSLHKEALDQIRTSAYQLERMVADLLDATRIDARRLTIEKEKVDLSTLVQSIVNRTTPVLSDHFVRLNLEKEVPSVEVDPGRLEQVVSNLLSNAAKYGYPGTEIDLHLRRTSDEVEISVSNKGEGIPSEELAIIFGRFRRATQAYERKIAGIGLGLYIAKGLVEAHGGRIWAESALGGTTSFYFTLPLMHAAPTEATAPMPASVQGV